MNSIIKTLILCTLSSITSQEIENQLTSSKGVIIGPKTPVFYLRYPRPDYLKVDRVENIFSASSAYNYYRDPSKRNGVFFVEILVVIDHFFYQYWIQKDKNEFLLSRWNKVDEYLGQLNYVKIKLAIRGVVISEVPDVWNSIGKQLIIADCNSIETNEYYFIPSTLDNMQNWFTNNKDSFEGLSYDMFIYMSANSFRMTNMMNDTRQFLSSTDSSAICTNNNINESVVKGGLVYDYDFFSYNAADIIARVLTVSTNDGSKCNNDYIVHSKFDVNFLETWSKCSRDAFRMINSSSKFDCLETVPYKEDEMDYDQI